MTPLKLLPWLMLSGTALAHPTGDSFAAQRFIWNINPHQINIIAQIELPPERLAKVSRGDETGERFLGRVPFALQLRVDESTLPLALNHIEHEVSLEDGHGRILTAHLSAPFDLQGTHRITLSNGLLTEEPSYFRHEITVPPGSTVLDDAFAGSKGVVAEGSWTMSEGTRDMSLTLDYPIWAKALKRPKSRLPEARPAPFFTAWLSGRPTGPTAIVLAAVLFALGLSSSTEPTNRMWRPLVVTMIASAALWWFPSVWLYGAIALFLAASALPSFREASALGAALLAVLGGVASGLGLACWLAGQWLAAHLKLPNTAQHLLRCGGLIALAAWGGWRLLT